MLESFHSLRKFFGRHYMPAEAKSEIRSSKPVLSGVEGSETNRDTQIRNSN
jgi:hypothetical protein